MFHVKHLGGGNMTDTNSEDVLIDDAQFSFRARNVLRSWHFGKLPPLKTLGDIAKLTRAELLRTPNCGQVTLADIVQTLAEHNLCLKDEPMKTGKVVYERVADRIRVRELEEKNDRLLIHIGYLQAEIEHLRVSRETSGSSNSLST
jgi:hypothetical protein